MKRFNKAGPGERATATEIVKMLLKEAEKYRENGANVFDKVTFDSKSLGDYCATLLEQKADSIKDWFGLLGGQ